jgi:2',3'-cyclic-nucleotide 2'-phosphodiesterase/3'-nucleotidase
MSCVAGAWRAGAPTGRLVQAKGHPESPAIGAVTQRAHVATVRYATSPIATTPDTWRADSARLADSPLTDFILAVEQRAAHADLASTAAFDTAARFGPGAVTVAQVAQLYPYDNTLRAVRISGAQLRDYLEYSSRYYRQTPDGAPVVDTAVAGYNFDVVSGVDYAYDLARPVGERVVTLTFHGRPVAPTDSFTLALNNYRQTGGGGYAMLRGARVVYDRQQEIRQLLADELRRRHTIRQSDYFVKNWFILPPRRAR